MRAPLLVLVVLLATSSVAQAQNRDAEAMRLYDAGARAYGAEHWDEALALFRESWIQSGRPQLLYDIAQCEDRLGHYTNAAFALERYVVAFPNGPNASEAQVRSRVLRERGLALETLERDAEARRREGLVLTVRDEEPPVTSQWWFWAAVGAGVVGIAAIIVGIVLGTQSDAPRTTPGMIIHIE